MDAIHRHFLDRDDVGVGVEILGGVDHLRQTAARVFHQHVRQDDGEGLITDQLARAPDGMAEAERRLLASEASAAGVGQVGLQKLEFALLAALDQGNLKFELAVEMVLDHALVAAGDKNAVLDAGLPRLVDDVLNQRPVDYRQHFLGHGLGGRQKAGAETGDGENGFADMAHGAGKLVAEPGKRRRG